MQASVILRGIRQRPWRRRLAALGVGLGALLALEVCLRLGDWGRPPLSEDPFVSFHRTARLFTLDPLHHTHVTAPERLKFFVKDTFPRKKTTSTFRIFCLGGSTVQGRPYSIETAFSSWLRLGLEAAYPDRRFEVVNCGGVSYASYRLLPILEECLAYEPDLFIVCTGQNEFLEERTYGHLKRWMPVYEFADKLHTYHLLKRLLPAPPQDETPRPVLKEEVDALLDYRGGLEAYHRDDALAQGVERHFTSNLHRLISMTQADNVPLILLRPPVNLKDCPPFKSESQRPETAALLTEAAQLATTDTARSITLLEQAVRRDPRCANAHYQLGRTHLHRADFRQAESHLWRALEEDVCPLRMKSTMAQSLARVCQQREIPLIDAHRLLSRECPQGLIGQEILVDHVHPSIRGHQLIAHALLQPLVEKLGRPNPGWEGRRKSLFQQHMESLDALYFARGQQRLQNLHRWTQGRSGGPSIHSRLPALNPSPAPPENAVKK